MCHFLNCHTLSKGVKTRSMDVCSYTLHLKSTFVENILIPVVSWPRPINQKRAPEGALVFVRLIRQERLQRRLLRLRLLGQGELPVRKLRGCRCNRQLRCCGSHRRRSGWRLRLGRLRNNKCYRTALYPYFLRSPARSDYIFTHRLWGRAFVDPLLSFLSGSSR